MRYSAKVDDNQPQIVKELRALGYSVKPVHQIKKFADILVGDPKTKTNWLFEIKDPAKPPSARKLTEGEQEFWDDWQGQIDLIETTEDAVRIMSNRQQSGFPDNPQG